MKPELVSTYLAANAGTTDGGMKAAVKAHGTVGAKQRYGFAADKADRLSGHAADATQYATASNTEDAHRKAILAHHAAFGAHAEANSRAKALSLVDEPAKHAKAMEDHMAGKKKHAMPLNVDAASVTGENDAEPDGDEAQSGNEALNAANGAPFGNKNAAGPHSGFEGREKGFPEKDIHGNSFGGLRKSQATALAKAHDSAMFKSKTPAEFAAHKLSRDANYKSENAFHGSNTSEEEKLHSEAADANRQAARAQRANGEWKSARQHEQAAAGHQTVADNLAWKKAGHPDIHWDSSD